jgi:putative flippase GtrA
VVGLIAAGVDFTTMLILVAAGLSPVPAKAVSWVAGTATAYIGNRRWTFQGDPSARRLLAVIGLYGLTFGLQVALFAWLYSWLVGLWDQWLAQLAAFVVAQAVATATNFMVQRHLIFRHR